MYADYEDNSGLYSEAAFIRPEQLQFYGYTANTSLEQIFKPAKSPAQSAKPYRTTMYVEKPHPYGFLQAIFEDTKLKDASGVRLIRTTVVGQRMPIRTIIIRHWRINVP